jgi:hypothetical protein
MKLRFGQKLFGQILNLQRKSTNKFTLDINLGYSKAIKDHNYKLKFDLIGVLSLNYSRN